MARLQHLTEEQVQQTFRRAQEIAHQAAPPSEAEVAESESEIEAYLRAAEELGIPRTAAEQALREKLLLPLESVAKGDLVFAPSVDGHHYPATVVRPNGATVLIEFVTGSEHTVATADLQPLALVPGREVEYREKDWGWIRGTIKTFNASKQRVELQSSWGETRKVTLDEIRLAAPKKKKSAREQKVSTLLWRTSLLVGSTAGILGWLIGHFWR
jgi:hypothetical protein